MNQCLGYFIDGTVTSDSHHHVHPFIDRLFGNLRSMSGILRPYHLIVTTLPVHQLMDIPQDGPFALSARNGIHDKYNSSFGYSVRFSHTDNRVEWLILKSANLIHFSQNAYKTKKF
jgi:hypothetical protein